MADTPGEAGRLKWQHQNSSKHNTKEEKYSRDGSSRALEHPPHPGKLPALAQQMQTLSFP